MVACALASGAARGEMRYSSDLEARQEGKRLEEVAALRTRQARALEALAEHESARARALGDEARAFAATRAGAQRWMRARTRSVQARAERSERVLARAGAARAGAAPASRTPVWSVSAVDPGAAQAPGAQRRRAADAHARERAALRAQAQRLEAAQRARASATTARAQGLEARKEARAARAAEVALREVLSDEALGIEPEPFAERKGWLEWPVRAGWNDVEDQVGRPRAEARVREDAALGSIGKGRIAWAGAMGGKQQGVIVTHEGGWMSVYVGVDPAREEGEWVQAGETIGIAQRGDRRDRTTVVGLEILKDGVGETPFAWMRHDDEGARGSGPQ